MNVALPPLPDFEIRRCLARGGMAEVYVANVLEGGLRDTDVILKRLQPQHANHRDYVALFLAEAKLGEEVVHDHIAQTYDLIHRGDEYFIVQEYVEGLTLAELKAASHVSIEALVPAFEDLLSALAYLHSGRDEEEGVPIIHRDVNPGNLVVRLDGVAKLIDFGIAEREGFHDVARTGALAGTPAYMSPEQARGRVLDRRSDVFSAGIILWELLARKPLFHGATEFETLRMICEGEVPKLPSELLKHFGPIMDVVLAREPLDRFDSAGTFLAAFQAARHEARLRSDREELANTVQRLATSRTADPYSAP